MLGRAYRVCLPDQHQHLLYSSGKSSQTILKSSMMYLYRVANERNIQMCAYLLYASTVMYFCCSSLPRFIISCLAMLFQNQYTTDLNGHFNRIQMNSTVSFSIMKAKFGHAEYLSHSISITTETQGLSLSTQFNNFFRIITFSDSFKYIQTYDGNST